MLVVSKACSIERNLHVVVKRFLVEYVFVYFDIFALSIHECVGTKCCSISADCN